MCIKNYIISIIIVLIFYCNLNADLLINEIACATPGDDWVELFYYSENTESREISSLHVTMYYGTSERLSDDPVTIFSYDKPETPWDDRFVVVHLTAPGGIDETDLTGDTNHNGYIDVYCNNDAGSLWNSDCVVAIDDDNNISNNGIIDFAAYSNRDGTPNSMTDNMETAQNLHHWIICPGKSGQECMIDIGKGGLVHYMSIARKSAVDTNSPDDFTITKYITPGRENILSENVSGSKNLFKPKKNKISVTPENYSNGNKEIELFVFENCNIRLRIFSSTGSLIYESPLYKDIYPGNFTLPWNLRGLGKKAATGLYIAHIEATMKEIKKSQEEKIYLIVNRYKK